MQSIANSQSVIGLSSTRITSASWKLLQTYCLIRIQDGIKRGTNKGVKQMEMDSALPTTNCTYLGQAIIYVRASCLLRFTCHKILQHSPPHLKFPSSAELERMSTLSTWYLQYHGKKNPLLIY